MTPRRVRLVVRSVAALASGVCACVVGWLTAVAWGTEKTYFVLDCGYLQPVLIGRYVPRKRAYAQRDVEAIRDAILGLLEDIEEPPFAVKGRDGDVPPLPQSTPAGRRQFARRVRQGRHNAVPGNLLPGNGPVLLAVTTEGDIPELYDDADPRWVASAPEHVIQLADHLTTNAAGYRTWQGAYLLVGGLSRGNDCDPWGNRYAVNIACFAGDNGPEWDVVVISAGPDEEIDSKFAQRGFVAGGDDIVAVVCRAREAPARSD